MPTFIYVLPEALYPIIGLFAVAYLIITEKKRHGKEESVYEEKQE